MLAAKSNQLSIFHRIWLKVACFTTLFAVVAPTLAAANCTAAVARLSYDTAEEQAMLQTSSSISSLSHHRRDPNRPDLAKFDRTLGTTAPKLSLKSAPFKFRITKDSKGFCATPVEGKISISMQQIVSVASNLPEKSCAYKFTLTHERKHVAVNSEYFSQIRRYFDIKLAKLGPYSGTGSTDKAAVDDAAGKITKALTKALDMYQADVEERQAKIDTPQEYRRINAACGALYMAKLLNGGK